MDARLFRSMSHSEAEKIHEDVGHYLIRSGTGDEVMIVDVIDDTLTGFRDYDAYGIDLRDVTDEQWESAGWDEDGLVK